MNDYFEFKKKIQELVKAWNTVIKPGIDESGQYGETNTRKYLIDPILDALNWVDDGSKKIIDNEFSVKHKTGTGSADYALKVNGIPKILVEAKDVAKIKDLENGYDTVHGIKRTYPRQLSNYCHDLNHQGFDIKFSILTNGKEWIVYNMKYADISSEREIIFRLNLEELDKDENIKNLWALEYTDICGDYHNLREIIQNLHDFRLDIDKKAVQQLLECKDLLSNSIFNDYEKNKRGIKDQIDDILQDKEQVNGMPIFQEIPEDERLNYFIKEASSSMINKILFIRILEDKNFLTPKLTKRSIEKWKDFFGYKDYDEIMNLFREACRISEKTYNGGLFRLNPYDKVEYDPNMIKKIIDILGDINFREIDSDIIGRIYEIYLGQVLKVESEIRGKKRTKYKADNKERKKLGQYYTPKFVVDFIVKNTLGKLIEGKTPVEVSKIRILDPAGGSGSFLINSYDTLAEYFENWNNEILKKIAERNKKQGAKLTNYSDTGAVPNYKNIILKENLHGVDINDLSVQICEINLWLRALERDKKLIKLNKNILHGNSLITGVENKEELSKFKNELEDIKKRQNQIKEYYDEDELPRSEEKRLEALEKNLKFIKNKVNEKLNENLKNYFNDRVSNVHPFNWEVEFPEVMQEGGFDVIIGNPPYVDIKGMPPKQVKVLFDTYYTCENRINLYSIFIEKSIHLLKKGGYFGFIIPNSILFNSSYKKIREILLKDTNLVNIVRLPDNVFEDAKVETMILIFKKKDSSQIHDTKILVYDRKDDINSITEERAKQIHSIKQNSWEINDNFIFNIFASNEINELISKIEENTTQLKELADFSLGITPYDKYKGHSKQDIENKVFHANYRKDTTFKKLISGEDIFRYGIFWNCDQWIKYGEWLGAPRQKRFFTKPRIVVRQIVSGTPQRIYAGYSEDELYNTQIAFNILSKIEKEINIKYLLAVLNSKLMNFYHTEKFLDKSKNLFQKILIQNAKLFPIKKIDNSEQQVFTKIVDNILNLIKTKVKIYELFDNALTNQSITEPKSCNFGRYFDSYDLYNIHRETFNNINEIKAKLPSVDIKEDREKLKIYVTINDESKKRLKSNIKAIELTIEDEEVKKFLFLSLKKTIDDKGGRGFGTGNILNLLKKMYVPFYVTNAKMNIEKIKEIMKEFNHNTKDLWWKSENKKERFNSLTEMEEEIEKTDREIDELVYELYGITKEEKKIIEDSLK
jgi:type I restriction-modification system DNA methylase subunit